MQNLPFIQRGLIDAYRGKSVLVTGHSGFKGSWLSHWLHLLGAEVYGYSLEPNTVPSLFHAAGVEGDVYSKWADIRDAETLKAYIKQIKPQVIFHLAAQPLVRYSYTYPAYTIDVNVNGTTNVLNAVRELNHPCAIVVVTSDKCYENTGAQYGYSENDPLGGHDAYSTSKAMAELVVASFQKSYFNVENQQQSVFLASARAGNVIGGGDWAEDRIVPDIVKALFSGKYPIIRNPKSTRPWQHVLEPLYGYLWLGDMLMKQNKEFCSPWNFGPHIDSVRTVADLYSSLMYSFGRVDNTVHNPETGPHEAKNLSLNIDKALSYGWQPRWSFERSVLETAIWYKAYYNKMPIVNIRKLMDDQIREYTWKR